MDSFIIDSAKQQHTVACNHQVFFLQHVLTASVISLLHCLTVAAALLLQECTVHQHFVDHCVFCVLLLKKSFILRWNGCQLCLSRHYHLPYSVIHVVLTFPSNSVHTGYFHSIPYWHGFGSVAFELSSIFHAVLPHLGSISLWNLSYYLIFAWFMSSLLVCWVQY